MSKYKVGDVVQLKSGGPKMTIDDVPETAAMNSYHCKWFKGNKLEQGYFSEEILVPVEPEKE